MSVEFLANQPIPAGPTQGRSYAPGSPESISLKNAILQLQDSDFNIPNVISGQEIFTNSTSDLKVPHDHQLQLGKFNEADENLIIKAIDSAVSTSKTWGSSSFEERAQPFLLAAQMLESGPWRDRLNAATMLELSKTSTQADGDATCETVDLIRTNFSNFAELILNQPRSSQNIKNEMEYRPLEGFVFSVSPFNFTSMSHLAFGPALLGNTVVWKPAESATLVSYLSLQLLQEAGLPAGVINLVLGNGAKLGPVALTHKNLAAVSFTGSTATFQNIFKTVGENISSFQNYPRIVGETGGKGFVFVHPSANIDAVVTACVRGAFEFQGQKCSAAARVYVPKSLWTEVRERLVEVTKKLVMGDPTSPETFLGAVINEKQFNYHDSIIKRAGVEAKILVGGKTDKTQGWFVEPTIIETDNPNSIFMTDEFFGPILSVYEYEDMEWQSILDQIDGSTIYGLGGSIFAQDEKVIEQALAVLKYTAGNISINDKPTGATVGEQPFGGARASGTNDKVGTIGHLSRFLSPRAIKRNLNPPISL